MPKIGLLNILAQLILKRLVLYAHEVILEKVSKHIFIIFLRNGNYFCAYCLLFEEGWHLNWHHYFTVYSFLEFDVLFVIHIFDWWMVYILIIWLFDLQLIWWYWIVFFLPFGFGLFAPLLDNLVLAQANLIVNEAIQG